MHIERLQDAIKVTLNSELLFPEGGWRMPASAQQTMSKMIPILAPMQQTKIMVNGYTDNVPIGPERMRQGVTSNLILSQKRDDNVMNFMTLQGVNPALVSAQGLGDADPLASNDILYYFTKPDATNIAPYNSIMPRTDSPSSHGTKDQFSHPILLTDIGRAD
jgi:chemotaxis protein MotB